MKRNPEIIKVERAIAEDATDTVAGTLHRLIMNGIKPERVSTSVTTYVMPGMREEQEKLIAM